MSAATKKDKIKDLDFTERHRWFNWIDPKLIWTWKVMKQNYSQKAEPFCRSFPGDVIE